MFTHRHILSVHMSNGIELLPCEALLPSLLNFVGHPIEGILGNVVRAERNDNFVAEMHCSIDHGGKPRRTIHENVVVPLIELGQKLLRKNSSS